MNEHKLMKEIDSLLNGMERLYPRLYRLEGLLKELEIELGGPLPTNGTLRTPGDYGHAICSLGKFLQSIGTALIRLEEEDGGCA